VAFSLITSTNFYYHSFFNRVYPPSVESPRISPVPKIRFKSGCNARPFTNSAFPVGGYPALGSCMIVCQFTPVLPSSSTPTVVLTYPYHSRSTLCALRIKLHQHHHIMANIKYTKKLFIKGPFAINFKLFCNSHIASVPRPSSSWEDTCRRGRD
jgi:hypothetical protein